MEVETCGCLGPCFGVQKAMDDACEVHRSNSEYAIYFSHPLVHNKLTNALVEKETGAKALESFEDAYLSSLPKNAFVMFSAHGHPKEEEEALKRHNIPFGDSFCPLLKTKYALIERSHKDPENVLLYVGKESHQETVATVSRHPYLFSISSDFDFDKQELPLPEVKGRKVYVFRQSTLVLFPFDRLKQLIEKGEPKSIFLEKPCPYLESRFLKIEDTKGDPSTAYVVVGDNTSSNAHELLRQCQEKHPDSLSVMVQKPEDVTEEAFKGITKAYLFSATSALMETVHQVLEKLQLL